MQTLAQMKSAGKGGGLKGYLQALHVHILLVAPLCAGRMAKSGADRREGGVTLREIDHRTGAAVVVGSEQVNTVIGRAKQQGQIIVEQKRDTREDISEKPADRRKAISFESVWKVGVIFDKMVAIRDSQIGSYQEVY